MQAPIISFKDFSFQYRAQKQPTLRHINLDIYPGERVLIAGPSGSGKSTLGSCLNGLIPSSLSLIHILGLIFFGLLPIAPWAIARYQRDGMAFFEKMLSIDVVKRATTVHEDHRGGAGYYVSYLLSDRAVLVASAAVLIALCWKACLLYTSRCV